MKKTLLATGIALAISSASIQTFAAEGYPDELDNSGEITTVKQGATFSMASIIGGLLAGPIGVMAGGIGGSVLGDELAKADEYEVVVDENRQAREKLVNTQLEMASLKEQLHIARQQQQQLHALAMTNLEFQVLFHTGTDDVNRYTSKRLDELAAFLKRNQELSIRLHGYADPRGTDEYNNVLSMHRAINVQQALENRGVDATRIERLSYGADKSQAPKGDLDAYALERRVSIEVFDPKKNGDVAIIE
ncbi:MAG: OmpA family protein [Cellvibrionaceae bacterium]